MSAKKDLSSLSIDELKSQFGAMKKVHTAIMVIFMVIILLWVGLGYWQKNLPMFISTVVMSIVISGSLVASRSAMRSELKKRNDEIS